MKERERGREADARYAIPDRNQEREMKKLNTIDQMRFHSTCLCLVYEALR